MKKRTLHFCFLFASGALFAQPVLVKDIHPGLGAGVYLGFARSAVLGNTLYFTADDDVHGIELWKSDGTAAGTVMVRDIYPGKSFDGPKEFYLVYDNQLYFTARDTTNDTELWRTDNGPEGAVLIRDACPTECDGANYGSRPRPMAEYLGKLYLNWQDFTIGEEFWVTDGTAAGSMLIKDINPGGGGSSSQPYGFTVFQGKLYFAADSANVGSELWESDGTAAGTRLVKNINTSSFGDSEMDAPVVGPDAFYFWARANNGDGPELWRSDGTAAGTNRVKDINPGSASAKPFAGIRISAWLGNQLLFVANDGTTGEELWSTDGTEAGTVLLADINPGINNSGIQFFASLNGQVLFKANDGVNGYELWVTNGTSAGTMLLKDIQPGSANGLQSFEIAYTVFQNKLIFTANDGVKGREIWISDGTAAGTVLLSDVDPGAAESNPSNYHVIGNTLFFFAQTNPTGRELWKYDLSSVGTNTPKNTLKFELNPTVSNTGIFNLVLEQNADATEPLLLEVHDLTGRTHATRTLDGSSQSVDLSGLPGGAYAVQLTGLKSGWRGVKQVFILP